MLTRTLTKQLHRVIAVSNFKGGAGKSSLTSNLAGLFAREGYRVLVIDLDKQGDQRTHLGYIDDPIDDDGAGLVEAFAEGVEPTPQPTKHAGLDVIAGGQQLEALEEMLITASAEDEADRRFAELLGPVAARYDVVLIDCPPNSSRLLGIALIAAHYLLVPVRSDENSLNGVERLARSVVAAKDVNPALEALGAVLFAFGTGATTLRAETRTAVDEIMSDGMVFEAFVRDAASVSAAEQRRGEPAHLIAQAVEQQDPWYKTLHRGAKTRRLPQSAIGVADDYERIFTELLGRIRTHDATFKPGKGR